MDNATGWTLRDVLCWTLDHPPLRSARPGKGCRFYSPPPAPRGHRPTTQPRGGHPMTDTLHAPLGAVDQTFAPPVITGTSSKEALDILFHALLEVARRH